MEIYGCHMTTTIIRPIKIDIIDSTYERAYRIYMLALNNYYKNCIKHKKNSLGFWDFGLLGVIYR